MGVEIERKFLVTSDDWRLGARGVDYRQGYLCREKGRTVRVRIAGDQGYLTVKGANRGASRPEFEYPVPLDDARELLGLCGPLVEKVRYRVPFGGLVWEVDEFRGDNEGLVVAEVELPTEDTVVLLPPWAGAEVTADGRYANSQLSVNPYCRW